MANQKNKLSSANKSIRLASVAILGTVMVFTTPAFAANRDMIQLQTQVQQLQDAVARLQQTNDERMGVMKDLVQQSADAVNKMSSNMDDLKKQMLEQQNAQGTKIDQVSGQIQSMNDSLDEVKARIGNLEKLLQNIQNQQQSINANMQNAQPAAGGGIPDNTAAPANAPSDAAALPAPNTGADGKPLAGTPLPADNGAPASPPADELYKTALGDYMSAKYSLASSEFGDVTKNYPDNPLSGNAFYYLGEIDYRAGHYVEAIKSYDKVISQYPASNKVPVSRLHKGNALIASKQTADGVRELRDLIQRFPNSPEAMQARSKLSGMGVPVKPHH
ncbi:MULTISPECIES: tetratricopeptide repeat protein [Acidobacteriaceae]|uniref:tetratricopeptide repeat protein n=1 Tax=Acidobacteriaceae TaxID=204434 RepID=UPI00131C718B|nr:MULTISPECIES: tetratricopeptide repeat protein [Acidobacteriaceae]MDW5265198.1 tetratricopeptide repeat protein [Edaphobacter sp.]